MDAVQTTRNKVIVTKLVVDFEKSKLVIDYKLGNEDENGKLVNVELESFVARRSIFKNEIEDSLGGSQPVVNLANSLLNKVRNEIRKKHGVNDGTTKLS
jgi:hypothetical protein